MVLVFASNNAHKLEEVRGIMPAGIEVLSLRDIGFESEIEETGTTLEENSLIKAEAVYHWILDNGHWTLDGVFADDTGLEIDALGGKPGVYTARWYRMNELTSEGVKELTNERAIFAANRAKALRELKGKEDRSAQFRTVITLIRLKDGAERLQDATLQVEGIVRGRIAEEEFGQGGFGYDPIFIPEGYDKTFGELPAAIKNGISHRARALQALVKVIGYGL
jgi:XTP/dITP diphosphohydrolase